MFMKKSVITHLLLGLLCSCSQGSQQAPKIENGYAINLEKESTPSAHDFFSKIEIFPLETHDSALLAFPTGECDKVVLHNDMFGFLQKRQQQILAFDSRGMYVKQLNRQGKGPGEYYTADDFSLSPTDKIDLLSSSGHYLMRYDARSLEWEKKIALPTELPAIHSFEIIDDECYLLLSSATDTRMYLFNTTTEEVIELDYSLPQWLNRNTTLSGRKPFYRCGKTLCYAQKYDGQVYSVASDGKSLTPRYRWDFGANTLTLENIPQCESVIEFMKNARNLSHQYAIMFGVQQENDRYYFTRFKFKNKYRHLIIDKTRQKHYLFETFQEGGQFVPQAVDEKCAYTFLPPHIASAIIGNQPIDADSRRVLEKLDQESNPVIVKYYLR